MGWPVYWFLWDFKYRFFIIQHFLLMKIIFFSQFFKNYITILFQFWLNCITLFYLLFLNMTSLSDVIYWWTHRWRMPWSILRACSHVFCSSLGEPPYCVKVLVTKILWQSSCDKNIITKRNEFCLWVRERWSENVFIPFCYIWLGQCSSKNVVSRCILSWLFYNLEGHLLWRNRPILI